MFRPPRAPGRTQEPHDQRARGTRPADRPPRPAPGSAPAGPPRLRGGRSPSLRPGRLDGFVPSPFRPGWGGDLTPAGGTDGVRAGGRGDRRRSGGNADQVARRSLRGLSREADGHRPAVIGRRRENIRRRADRGDLRTPTANAAGAGFSRGSKGGGSTPRQPRGYTGDSPPFVSGVKGGTVTPHRGVGRAG